MINLADYGKLIMKQEFTVDARENKIINALYLGRNENYDEDSIITIIMDPNEHGGFKCTVASNKGVVTCLTSNVDTVNRILSVAECADSEGENTPVSICSYNNAMYKTDDSYTVTVNGVGLEIDKNKKLVLDSKYFADEDLDTLNFSTHYEFHRYGVYCDDKDNNNRMYLLRDQFTSDDSTTSIELGKIKDKQCICSVIPNLNHIPENIVFYSDSEVTYRDDIQTDQFNVIYNCDNNLYEIYTSDEYDTPIFVSSMHPFYYDNFDTSIIPSRNRYCVDQIDRSLDDGEFIIIYSREVYDIDNIDKLLKDIELAKDKKEPSIPII